MRRAPLAGLLAAGQFRGRVPAGLELLQRSPIYRYAGKLLDDLEVEGAVSGELALAMDIRSGSTAPRIVVTTELTEARVKSRLLALTLDNVEGGLDFNSEAGFSSRNLRSTLFGEPVLTEVGSR
jgi:uncharacterized protein YhdP